MNLQEDLLEALTITLITFLMVHNKSTPKKKQIKILILVMVSASLFTIGIDYLYFKVPNAQAVCTDIFIFTLCIVTGIVSLICIISQIKDLFTVKGAKLKILYFIGLIFLSVFMCIFGYFIFVTSSDLINFIKGGIT